MNLFKKISGDEVEHDTRQKGFRESLAHFYHRIISKNSCNSLLIIAEQNRSVKI